MVCATVPFNAQVVLRGDAVSWSPEDRDWAVVRDSWVPGNRVPTWPQSELQLQRDCDRETAFAQGEQKIRILTLALAADVWSDAR